MPLEKSISCDARKMNTHRSVQNRLKPTNWRIEQLPGISSEDQARLIDCGITTTLQLLQQCHNQEQKHALSEKLQVHIHHVSKWVALSDLSRIPSVGCQYCGLLLHAGIASAAQLAQMHIHKVHQQILRLQVATMQRRDLCPSRGEIVQWIQQARLLST
jgi:predicted flap endonuclease-1-like 5' DNA nuclease